VLISRFCIFLLLALLLSSGVSAAPVQEFVVVVHKDRKISSLSGSDLKRIFLGKQKKWPDGEAVIPVFNLNREVYDLFAREMLNKSEAQLKTYWRKQLFSGQQMMPQMVNSNEEIVDYLSRSTNAISYLPKEALVDPLRPVRIVP